MQIQTFSKSYYNINPSFTSSSRETREAGKIVSRNVTNFFRDDLKWNKFVDEIIRIYENQGKINVYSIACSYGDEAFSLAMLLVKKLGYERAQKFFPIKAYDVDESVINRARKGEIKLSNFDLKKLKEHLGEDLSPFLTHDLVFKNVPEENELLCEGKVSDRILNAVEFHVKDVRNVAPELQSDNSLVLARNFWPYLKDEQYTAFQNVLSKLENNCAFVFGEYDLLHSPHCFGVTDCGFELSKVDYMWVKNNDFALKDKNDLFKHYLRNF